VVPTSLMIVLEARACRAIILDPLGLMQLAHADRFRPAEAPHLLAYLAGIDDPRTRAGRRHPLVVLVVIAAVLAGAHRDGPHQPRGPSPTPGRRRSGEAPPSSHF
jgi:hypothetical protein